MASTELPAFVAPMLLTRAPRLPADEDQTVAVEIKHDGIRAQVRVDRHGAVTVRTRHGRDCTRHFPELAALAEPLAGRPVLLDGELTVLDDHGRPDFAAVMARRTSRPPARPNARLRLHIFDVLHLDGRDLSPLPYLDRRDVLSELTLDGPHWTTPPHYIGRAGDIFAAVRDLQLEGVVLKPIASRYRAGRRGPWAKYKATRLHDRLAVRAVEATEREPAGFVVARPGPSGRLHDHQIIRHGLAPAERARLRRLLQRNGAVAVTVRAHGRPDGVLRDPVLDAIVA